MMTMERALTRTMWLLTFACLLWSLAVGQAQAAVTINSVTLNGGASVTVAPGASITVVISVTTDTTNWRSTSWQIGTGAVTCVDHTNHDGNYTTYSETFTITAPATIGTYNATFIAASDSSCGSTTTTRTLNNAVTVAWPAPIVISINRASFDPTTSNTAVSWTVVFNTSVTEVDDLDFNLVQTGGAAGATITSVTGSGTTWTVNANTGTGTSGSLRLDLVDNDTIVNASNVPLGGSGIGNGNFAGQSYTILAPTCTGATDVIFCDDFERSSPGGIGNGWTYTENTPSNCTGVAGNRRCAGIDSDIPPFSTYSNPRANPTRSMFTRWDIVTVQSPTINLASRPGAELSFWMRRGGDAFSEYPEATGENYLVQYRDNTGTWKVLAQYPSGVQEGQVFTPTIELPPDALHANFALRFYQPSGSGDAGGGTGGGAPGVVGYDYWHLDDVVVRERTVPKYVGASCDNFEGGLGRWSISAEGAPVGATIGDASLGTLTYASATHSLDLRWGYVVASSFKTDLTGVTGNITYWVRSGTGDTRDPDSGEDLIVQYLNSSGVWTSLATYAGGDPAGTIYNASHPIPDDAKHANFRLRFRHLNASGYDRDYWHVDDVCVGDLVPTADLAITKTRNGSLVPGTNVTYNLAVVNNGPGILSGSLQVVDTLPSALSYLSAGGGLSGWTCSANGQEVTCNWSGTLAVGASPPLLTMTVYVSPGATGTITNSATVTGTVVDNVPGNNTGTDSATIYIPSYVFTDKPCQSGVAIGSGANPCNLIVWSPQTAGVAKGSVYITALNASGIPTQLSGVSNTTVNFQFALSCIQPATDAGVQATFSAVGSALPLCEPNGNVPSTWSSGVNLVFAAGSPSVGPYSFNYNDVGNVELYVRNGAATSQIGQSGPFVVKPYSLVLTDIKCTTANAANCGTGALAMTPAGSNPAAADASGATFIRAGDPFSVTVTGVNASCAGSLASYTKLADIPSSCIAPNFGKNNTATVSLGGALSAGLGLTANPAIANATDFGTFSGGSATGTTFAWGEVGIIELTPSVADYLGAGSVTGLATGKVGRFYPHHFDVEATDTCPGGSFTYSGQPFPIKVTAKNKAGGTTANYKGGGFAKSNTYSDANNLATPLGVFSPTTLAAASFNNGVADLTAAPWVVSFAFNPAPHSPADIKPRVTDEDGATSKDGTESTLHVRSGRLRMTNAYGSQLLPIRVPVRAEYFVAGNWRLNSDDTCTAIASGNVAIGNCQGNLTSQCTAAGGEPNPGTVVPSLSSATLVNGQATLLLTRPGCPAPTCPSGTFDLAINLGAAVIDNSCNTTHPNAVAGNLPWLRFGWCVGGGDPNARVKFGSSKAPYIYLRERY